MNAAKQFVTAGPVNAFPWVVERRFLTPATALWYNDVEEQAPRA